MEPVDCNWWNPFAGCPCLPPKDNENPPPRFGFLPPAFFLKVVMYCAWVWGILYLFLPDLAFTIWSVPVDETITKFQLANVTAIEDTIGRVVPYMMLQVQGATVIFGGICIAVATYSNNQTAIAWANLLWFFAAMSPIVGFFWKEDLVEKTGAGEFGFFFDRFLLITLAVGCLASVDFSSLKGVKCANILQFVPALLTALLMIARGVFSLVDALGDANGTVFYSLEGVPQGSGQYYISRWVNFNYGNCLMFGTASLLIAIAIAGDTRAAKTLKWFIWIFYFCTAAICSTQYQTFLVAGSDMLGRTFWYIVTVVICGIQLLVHLLIDGKDPAEVKPADMEMA